VGTILRRNPPKVGKRKSSNPQNYILNAKYKQMSTPATSDALYAVSNKIADTRADLLVGQGHLMKNAGDMHADLLVGQGQIMKNAGDNTSAILRDANGNVLATNSNIDRSLLGNIQETNRATDKLGLQANTIAWNETVMQNAAFADVNAQNRQINDAQSGFADRNAKYQSATITDSFARLSAQGENGFARVAAGADNGFARAAVATDGLFGRLAAQSDNGFARSAVANDTNFTRLAAQGDNGFARAAVANDGMFGRLAAQGDNGFARAAVANDGMFGRLAAQGDNGFARAAVANDSMFGRMTAQNDNNFARAALSADTGFSRLASQADNSYARLSAQNENEFSRQLDAITNGSRQTVQSEMGITRGLNDGFVDSSSTAAKNYANLTEQNSKSRDTIAAYGNRASDQTASVLATLSGQHAAMSRDLMSVNKELINQAAVNAAAVQLEASKNVAAIQLQAALNAKDSQLEASKNTAGLQLQAALNSKEAVLQASNIAKDALLEQSKWFGLAEKTAMVNKSDIENKMASFYSDIKETVVGTANVTQALIQSTESNRIRDSLSAAMTENSILRLRRDEHRHVPYPIPIPIPFNNDRHHDHHDHHHHQHSPRSPRNPRN
jgi:hypothetical protein